MVGLSSYTANAGLNWLAGISAMPSLGPRYLALFTAVGTDDGTGFSEVSGNNYARAQIGGTVTHGVPKELWDAWFAENKNSDIVRNRLIFAYEDANSGNAEASELRSLKTGMEPLSQGKDERVAALQRSTQAMTGIETFSQAEA